MNSFFLFDVIVNFFTAYEDNDLVIHDSLKDIAINYIKTWFVFDFISALPLYSISTTYDIY